MVLPAILMGIIPAAISIFGFGVLFKGIPWGREKIRKFKGLFYNEHVFYVNDEEYPMVMLHLKKLLTEDERFKNMLSSCNNKIKVDNLNAEYPRGVFKFRLQDKIFSWRPGKGQKRFTLNCELIIGTMTTESGDPVPTPVQGIRIWYKESKQDLFVTLFMNKYKQFKIHKYPSCDQKFPLIAKFFKQLIDEYHPDAFSTSTNSVTTGFGKIYPGHEFLIDKECFDSNGVSMDNIKFWVQFLVDGGNPYLITIRMDKNDATTYSDYFEKNTMGAFCQQEISRERQMAEQSMRNEQETVMRIQMETQARMTAPTSIPKGMPTGMPTPPQSVTGSSVESMYDGASVTGTSCTSRDSAFTEVADGDADAEPIVTDHSGIPRKKPSKKNTSKKNKYKKLNELRRQIIRATTTPYEIPNQIPNGIPVQ